MKNVTIDIQDPDSRIYEIYTDESGSFSVGMICAENRDDLLFAGIDEEGKVSAYYAMPRKVITQLCEDTEYLRKIRLYMAYAAEHPYSSWFRLPAISLDPGGPILSQLLRLAMTEV